MSSLAKWLDPTLIQSLNHLVLSGRGVAQGLTAGAHRSSAKGLSLEFRQHRAYVSGDEPRRIDWRVMARSDRVFVKEYDAETNLRAMILLDASGSMGYGQPRTKFHYAARLAAALAYLALAQQERIGLAIAGGTDPDYIPPTSAATQLTRVIHALSKVRPIGPTSLDSGMTRLAERMGRRSLIIIVTDAFASVARLKTPLSRLAFGRHEVMLVRVLHPDELAFPFDHWTTFHGLEQEPAVAVDLAASKSRYSTNFRKHDLELQSLCRRLKVAQLSVTTSRPLLEAVRAVVHRRDS